MPDTPPIASSAARITVASLTIPERVELLRRSPRGFRPDPERGASIRAKWREKLGLPANAPLTDRFEDLGLLDEEFDTLIGDIDLGAVDLAAHADWSSVLADVLSRESHLDAAGLPRASFLLDDDEVDPPAPFEHAYVGWIERATELLRDRLGSRFDALAADILRAEQRSLLSNLAILGRDTFLQQLRLNRVGVYDGNDFALGFLSTTPPRRAYAATIRAAIGENRHEWWLQRAALARLLSVRTLAWVRSFSEILEHLEEDLPRIAKTFFEDREPGVVTSIDRGIGDSHNGGRSVAILSFESGCKIVYKPRNMGIDEQFVRIVDSLNSQLDESLQLEVPRSWDRGVYGWMEFAQPSPCQDEEAVRRYHRRMGVLLAVVHALQGNDFHLENVMASGDHPVPIDLETVSVPTAVTANHVMQLVDSAAELVDRSVLRTLLLPSIMARPGLDPVNLGALEIEQQNADGSRSHLRLDHPNTDFQRWVRVEGDDPRVSAERISQVRRSDGEPISSELVQDEISEGYRRAYEAILRIRDQWTDQDGPIARMSPCLVRVINRATSVYYRLLLETCRHEHIATGVDRWLHLERLALAIDQDAPDFSDPTALKSIRTIVAALVAAEQASLMDGDVAYFVARGGGIEYHTVDPETCEPRRVSRADLAMSAVDAAQSQLRRMGPEDLRLQRRLQASSYLTAYQTLNAMLHGDGPSLDQAPTTPPIEPDVSRDDLRTAALGALDWIDDEKISSEESINWIQTVMDTQADTLRPGPLDSGIYAGRGGISLTFELAYRTLKDPRWLDLAAGSVNLEMRAIQAGLGNLAGLNLPPSGMLGRGGLLASLWCIGRHEGKGAHREVARRLATELSDRAIENDDAYDMISGSAGQIMLLVGMLQEEAIPGGEATVARLADHLLRTRVDIDGPGWRLAPDRIPVCGLGHGRAGIALAMLQAGRLLNRSDLRDSAIEVFEAEHRLRGDEPAKGWPDFRGLGDRSPRPGPCSSPFWCNGLEGIALSRAAALQIEDHPLLRDDLEFCLAGLASAELPHRHHLCCGSAGRFECDQTLQRLCGTAPLFTEERLRSRLARSLAVEDTHAHGMVGAGLFQGVGGPLWSALGHLGAERSDILLLRI